ncbi:hypothetical protein V8F33_007828 [Rhypophila sp. PSN 637]
MRNPFGGSDVFHIFWWLAACFVPGLLATCGFLVWHVADTLKDDTDWWAYVTTCSLMFVFFVGHFCVSLWRERNATKPVAPASTTRGQAAPIPPLDLGPKFDELPHPSWGLYEQLEREAQLKQAASAATTPTGNA